MKVWRIWSFWMIISTLCSVIAEECTDEELQEFFDLTIALDSTAIALECAAATTNPCVESCVTYHIQLHELLITALPDCTVQDVPVQDTIRIREIQASIDSFFQRCPQPCSIDMITEVNQTFINLQNGPTTTTCINAEQASPSDLCTIPSCRQRVLAGATFFDQLPGCTVDDVSINDIPELQPLQEFLDRYNAACGCSVDTIDTINTNIQAAFDSPDGVSCREDVRHMCDIPSCAIFIGELRPIFDNFPTCEFNAVPLIDIPRYQNIAFAVEGYVERCTGNISDPCQRLLDIVLQSSEWINCQSGNAASCDSNIRKSCETAIPLLETVKLGTCTADSLAILNSAITNATKYAQACTSSPSTSVSSTLELGFLLTGALVVFHKL